MKISQRMSKGEYLTGLKNVNLLTRLQRTALSAAVRTTEEKPPPLKKASPASAGTPRNLKITATTLQRKTTLKYVHTCFICNHV